MTTQDSPNGSTEEQLEKAVFTASMMLKTIWEGFNRSMQLIGFPQQVNPGAFALFQMCLSLLTAQQTAGAIQSVQETLLLLVQRTDGENGGLDTRAIEREIARRNVAIAMGPDPAVLEQLMRLSHHRNAVDSSELETLKQQNREIATALAIVRDHVRTAVLTHKQDESIQERTETQELRDVLDHAIQLLQPAEPGIDPGSIPPETPIDGRGSDQTQGTVSKETHQDVSKETHP